jgi:hypothetical protein
VAAIAHGHTASNAASQNPHVHRRATPQATDYVNHVTVIAVTIK